MASESSKTRERRRAIEEEPPAPGAARSAPGAVPRPAKAALPHYLRDIKLTSDRTGFEGQVPQPVSPEEAAAASKAAKLTTNLKQRAAVGAWLHAAAAAAAAAAAEDAAAGKDAETKDAELDAHRTGLRLTERHPVPTIREVLIADAAARAKAAGASPEECVAAAGAAITPEAVKAAKWWENINLDNLDGSALAFSRVEWPGPAFLPPFERPPGLTFRYAGVEYPLTDRQAELALDWAKMQHLEHVKKPVFRKNFWSEFIAEWRMRKGRPEGLPTPARLQLPLADFSEYIAYAAAHAAAAKARTPEQKAALKAANLAERTRHSTAMLDGRRVELGSWKVEPPGLFRGRGSHPKTGLWKARITPEDVILNVPSEEHLPPVPAPYDSMLMKWGGFEWAPNEAWLAKYWDSLGKVKYVRLGASSASKGLSDFAKFERARRLAGCVERVRQEITAKMMAEDLGSRQLGLIAHLIDTLAIRPGGDKNTDNEADTVGATSLRAANIHPIEPGSSIVRLDFLGKDSVRYVREVEFADLPLRVLNECLQGKAENEKVFSSTSHVAVNAFLTSLMPGLTAKVFRTFNASLLLDRALTAEPAAASAGTIADRLAYFNSANLEVARLCNHQRNVSASFGASLATADVRLNVIQRALAHAQLVHLLAVCRVFALGGQVPGWTQAEVAKVDVEAVTKTVVELDHAAAVDAAEKRRQREILRIAREQNISETQAAEDIPAVDPEELTVPSREPPSAIRPAESALQHATAALARAYNRLNAETQAMGTREQGATLATSTSRINYIDPRIIVAWSRRVQVPITKVMTRPLLVKFLWGLEASAEWRFPPNVNETHFNEEAGEANLDVSAVANAAVNASEGSEDEESMSDE